MSAIDNRSGFPHAWVEKTGPGGQTFDVLVVRGTYDFAGHGQRLTLADSQAPIAYGDLFSGPAEDNPLHAVLRVEGDLAVFKPATDVYVTGKAHAKDDMPQVTWMAGIQIGPVRKLLRLHGPRRFERNWGRWRLSRAEPAATIPLDYRRAFGGSFASEASDEVPAEFIYKLDNPAGCGWLPGSKALKELSKPARKEILAAISRLRQLDAPQIEDASQPVTHPKQRMATQGFGPVARWCQPRLAYAGTYDAAWRKDAYPELPEDFDPRFHNAASSGLVCPAYLQGTEILALTGMLPEGPLTQRLPGAVMLATTTAASGRKTAAPMSLDTVAIDLDARQVTLVWRSTFGREDPVRSAALGFIAAPDRVLSTDMSHG